MAKYDDFGRPIYETAEEYNKARRAAGGSPTYTNTNGVYQQQTIKETHRTKAASQRYTNQTGAKKTKSVVIGLAAFFIVLNMVIVFSIFNSLGVSFEEEYEVNGGNWFETTDGEGYGEYIGDNITPLPEGFETFTYNGQTYTLPESYEQLVDEGFMEEGYDFYIDNPLVFGDGVTVSDFVFGDGLTFESSYEELEAYFGTPYYHYEDHSEPGYYYDSYEWCYNGDYESHYVCVTFLDGVMADVMIDKTVYEE